MKLKNLAITMALLVLPACVVTKEQHETLTQAFDAYVTRTEPLIQAEIANIGTATPADVALSQMTQGWLDDAKMAVHKHKVLAGLESEPSQ